MSKEMRTMPEDIDISDALELCGFLSGDRQQSRLMNLLSIILKLQKDPPIPLAFAEIYDQLMKEEPEAKLTKAWVHRVLKSLVEIQLVRIENPTSHRKRFIADVNTVMAGLEQLKTNRIHELEEQKSEIDKTLEDVTDLDCGTLTQQFIKTVTGTQQKISSRIVRGVDELHRVLRYNMLDVAKKGDTIRATVLWLEPFVGDNTLERTRRFIEAAQRGADVRYMLSTDVFRRDEARDAMAKMEGGFEMLRNVLELRKSGVKFNVRLYDGQNTYNQVSFNNDNMALVIAENPVTAIWITRDFNPDLIDNAVRAFDKDWKKAKSFLDMTPKEMQSLGVLPRGLISEIVIDDREGLQK
jgi:Fe2+ or Zn2+ uptake regulation protein